MSYTNILVKYYQQEDIDAFLPNDRTLYFEEISLADAFHNTLSSLQLSLTLKHHPLFEYAMRFAFHSRLIPYSSLLISKFLRSQTNRSVDAALTNLFAILKSHAQTGSSKYLEEFILPSSNMCNSHNPSGIYYTLDTLSLIYVLDGSHFVSLETKERFKVSKALKEGQYSSELFRRKELFAKLEQGEVFEEVSVLEAVSYESLTSQMESCTIANVQETASSEFVVPLLHELNVQDSDSLQSTAPFECVASCNGSDVATISLRSLDARHQTHEHYAIESARLIYAPPNSGKSTWLASQSGLNVYDTDHAELPASPELVLTNRHNLLKYARKSIAIVPSKAEFNRRCTERGLDVKDQWYSDVLHNVYYADKVIISNAHVDEVLKKFCEYDPGLDVHLWFDKSTKLN